MKKISKENKKFFRTLAFLAIPIIASEILNASVNLVDSFMVGSLGLNSINGVGFANQIFFLFALVVFGINSGSSMFMGQYFGKGDEASVRKVMGIAGTVGFCAALVFFCLAEFAPRVILGLYTNSPDVLDEGEKYLRIAAPTYFLIAISWTISAALKSCRQTKIPLATTTISLLTNVVLNYVFIFVLKWGVSGAAAATLIARVLELAAAVTLIFTLKLPAAGKIRGYFIADAAFLKSFFKLVLPVMLNEFCWALGTTTYNIAYKFAGNEAQGAVQISNAVYNIFTVFAMGVGSACGIMISNVLGAGDSKLGIRYSKKAMILVLCIGVVMCGVIIAASPAIVNIYNVSPEVRAMARSVLFVIAFGQIFKTYSYTTIVGILRSGGDTRFCLACDVVGVWCIGVPCAFLGAAILHLPIWAVVAMVLLEEVFKFFITTWRVLSKKWAATIV
ncbi:MATE family efflux transporter [Clostridia bacterium]|nr:MATE family efflux transporter [Clostridia bacterium]